MTEPYIAWTWIPDPHRHRVLSARFRGGVLVVGYGSDGAADSGVLALDPVVGRTLWAREVPGMVAGPGGTREVIAVLDRERDLYGFRLGDGAQLWRRRSVIGPGRPAEDARKSAVFHVGTAARGRDLFTVTREWTRTLVGIDGPEREASNEIAVLDADGRVRDRRSGVSYYDDSWTRPVREFSLSWRRIVARDVVDASVRWRSRKWRGSTRVHICVDREAGLVIGVGEYGIRAYDIATGFPRWRRRGVRARPGVAFSLVVRSAVVSDGVLCVEAGGRLTAFRTATGVLLWRRDIDDGEHDLRADRGVLYLLGPRNTNLRAFAASDGAELWHCTPDAARPKARYLIGVRDGFVYVSEGEAIRALRAPAPDRTVRPGGGETGLEVFHETAEEAERLAVPLPRLGRRFLLGLEREHRAHAPDDGSFHVVSVRGRDIAVAEYGSRFYDEGIPVHLAVDLRTGAFQHWHANAVENRSRPSLALARLVPPWDPVRRWLAAGPTAAPVTVTIRTRGQLARFSAAEIARADRPGPAAVPHLKASPLLTLTSPRTRCLIRDHPAETLPYQALFGHQVHAPTHIGADPRPTPAPADRRGPAPDGTDG
ncbi:outer membrane protein assembly factor BamB family protein [Streptomyces sp. NPDC001153]